MDPRCPPVILEVGAYMTDGRQLVEILEADVKGALGEDVCSELLVPIEARDYCRAGDRPERVCWRRVIPAR